MSKKKKRTEGLRRSEKFPKSKLYGTFWARPIRRVKCETKKKSREKCLKKLNYNSQYNKTFITQEEKKYF